MKYSLAFDRGEEYSEQERYIVLPLLEISPKLDLIDNFSQICSFTMQYKNEGELKKRIFECLPEFKFYKDCSLVILKGKRHLGEIVPYAWMQKYFDLEKIAALIMNNIENVEFRNMLLAPYSHIKYFAVVSNNLRQAGNFGKDLNYLRKCVNDFLTKICTDEKLVDFRQLYKMVVLVLSSLDMLYASPCYFNELSCGRNEDIRDSESPTEFQKEWLIRRKALRKSGKWQKM